LPSNIEPRVMYIATTLPSGSSEALGSNWYTPGAAAVDHGSLAPNAGSRAPVPVHVFGTIAAKFGSEHACHCGSHT
jgi:hypothetical protein